MIFLIFYKTAFYSICYILHHEKDTFTQKDFKNTFTTEFIYHSLLRRISRVFKYRMTKLERYHFAGSRDEKIFRGRPTVLPNGTIEASRFMRLIRTERSDSTRKRS